MKKIFRGAVTAAAVAAALGLISPAIAQSNVTGGIKGNVQTIDSASVEGATVTIRNTETGFRRTVTVSDRGEFRVGSLPVGTYEVIASKAGFADAKVVEIRVTIGNDVNLNIQLASDSVERIAVTGARVLSTIDVSSAEVSLNISAAELSKLPVARDVASVALLAPGTTRGDSRFGNVASFGGASAAENIMYINGLNVTNFRNGLGFSQVPYEFYDQFQIKTGGYSVEYGRSTGGVINAVTKSGTNTFQAGASVYWRPDFLRASSPNVYHEDGSFYAFNSERELGSTQANVWASGALIQDKLFYFVLYNPRKSEDKYQGGTGQNGYKLSNDDAFWGGKIDWLITDNHKLELLAFSDSNDDLTDAYNYSVETRSYQNYLSTTTDAAGGKNWSLSYTGHLTDDLTIKALYGKNKYDLSSSSNVLEDCTLIQDGRQPVSVRPYGLNTGCTTTAAYRGEEGKDEREAIRFDIEYVAGDHLIRAGIDREVNSSYSNQYYSGENGDYIQVLSSVGGTSLANGAIVPVNSNSHVRTRFRTVSGDFETISSAYYLEDIWAITPNITATIGIRNETFNNKNGAGNTFVKMSNQWAPRAGLSWDIHGDGSAKAFVNLGRYHLPVANNTNIRLSGNELDYFTYYEFNNEWEAFEFNGNTYHKPVFGNQLGDRRYNATGEVPDTSAIVAHNLDPMYQDEIMLGYQAEINDNWTWGVRGVQRILNGAIDDMIIDHALQQFGCGEPGQYVLGNPGQDMVVAIDCPDNPEFDGQVVTLKAADLIYDKAKRKYYALNFTLDRAWRDDWTASFSYTWAHSYGNTEGMVKSDNAQSDAGLTQDFDYPELMDGAYGNLPNDRRHAFKLYGAYAIADNFSVGLNARIESGRPINAFGISHPNGRPGYGDTYYTCSNCSDEEIANGEAQWHFNPRGSQGTTPWTAQFDLSALYTLTLGETDIELKADVFNIFNSDTRIRVNEYAETGSQGNPNPTYLYPNAFQPPRSVQLSASVKF